MSAMQFAENVLAGLLIFAIIFIVVPTLTYYLCIFYSHRSNPIIHKRHYQTLIALNILLMLSLVGDKSLYMTCIIITDNLEEAHSHILYVISDYVYFIVGPSILITMSLFCWMVFYDISWAIVTNPKNQWTHFIDPAYQDHQSKVDLGDLFANNWFIKHQQNFGNIRWIVKYIIIPLLCIVNVSLFLSLSIAPHYHYFIFMAWMALCVLFIAVTYWNIPKQTVEIFKIKKQLDQLMRISVSFVIFFATYIALRLFIDAPQFQYMIIMTFQYIFTGHYFIAGLVSTRYVLCECGIISRHSSRTVARLASYQSSSVSRSKSMPLAHILQNRISLNAFMSHVLSEFSSENLLAIFECLQFKQMIEELNTEQYAQLQHAQQDSTALDSIVVYIQQAMQKGGAVEEYVFCEKLMMDASLKEYRLPPKKEIPQSVIVYDANLSVKEKASKLVEKYVYSAGGCMFEVNISSMCRYRIVQQCKQFEQEQKIQIQQVYGLFDEMILELIGLSNDSHRRFVKSDAYAELIKHVDV